MWCFTETEHEWAPTSHPTLNRQCRRCGTRRHEHEENA